MTTPGSVRRAGITLWLALAACGRPEQRTPDTTLVEFDEPGSALASRQECQAALDAARRALVRKDVDRCVTELAEAATFFRAEAVSAAPEVRWALVAAAEEFETLLANVARGRPRTPRDFDRVFAQAHAAEAALHLSRARVAWLQRDHARAGEELLMTSDHLERAAKDARLRTDPILQRAIADTRTLAMERTKGMAAVPDEVQKVSTEIGDAIQRIGQRVYVPTGPEPPNSR